MTHHDASACITHTRARTRMAAISCDASSSVMRHAPAVARSRCVGQTQLAVVALDLEAQATSDLRALQAITRLCCGPCGQALDNLASLDRRRVLASFAALSRPAA